jgi:hypothetical protein
VPLECCSAHLLIIGPSDKKPKITVVNQGLFDVFCTLQQTADWKEPNRKWLSSLHYLSTHSESRNYCHTVLSLGCEIAMELRKAQYNILLWNTFGHQLPHDILEGTLISSINLGNNLLFFIPVL